MRRLVTVAVSLLLAAGLSGCGIPDETGVHIEGVVPGQGGKSDANPPGPPERTASGDDHKKFVVNFLSAAAGEMSGAHERVAEYVAPARRPLLPKPDDEAGVHVVRLTEPLSVNYRQDNTSTVTIKVQHVGVLRSNGVVEPPELTDTTYTFVVGKLAAATNPKNAADAVGQGAVARSPGLFVLQPPPVLLMSEEALREYYEQRTIYFWSKDRRRLVPDLRHLPRAIPPSRRADEVVNWLTRGPAGWLADTVVGLPTGIQKSGNVTQSDGRVVVNFSVDPAAGQNQKQILPQLVTQLVWSLGDYHAGALEVKFKEESREVVDIAEARSRPIYDMAEGWQRYAVYGGVVHALKQADGTPSRVPIAPNVNRDVVSASLASVGGSPVAAALVVDSGGGRRLAVGSGLEQVEEVRHSPAYVRMGRPVWLRSTFPVEPRGLVVADGRLYEFRLYGGGELQPVDLPGGPENVVAVAAALDGHRIAYIADGELYVAGLTISDRALKVHSGRRLNARLGSLTAVEWVGENRLVVAGVADDNQVALHDVGVDGALIWSRASERGTAEITHLAAYPENPVGRAGERVMYEVNGVAWDAFTGDRLEVDDLETMPDESRGPSGSPTAPFFVY